MVAGHDKIAHLNNWTWSGSPRHPAGKLPDQAAIATTAMRPTIPAFPYDHAQIVRALDAKTVEKGQRLVDAVSNIFWENDALCGDVQGSQKFPYEVQVFFERVGELLIIEGECSCPVGFNCKHVAALLLANLAQVPAPTNSATIRPELVQWLEHFKTRQNDTDTRKTKASKSTQALVYALVPSAYEPRCQVAFFKASLDREGHIRSVGDSWSNVENALLKPPQFITEEDLSILRLLWLGRSKGGYGGFSLTGANGGLALASMLATGRLAIMDQHGHKAGPLLRPGNPRPGNIQWQPYHENRLQAFLQSTPPASAVIMVDPLWYVDRATGEAGPVEIPWEANRIIDYLSMPPITLTEVPLVAAVLKQIAPNLPMPPSAETASMRVLDVTPVPVLHLNTLPLYPPIQNYTDKAGELDHASVSFRYDSLEFEVGNTTTLVKTADGSFVQVKRQMEIEKARLAELRQRGLDSIPAYRVFGPLPFPKYMWGLDKPDDWHAFMRDTLPVLRDSGWRVEMQADFRHNVIDIDDIDGHLREAADGWFDLEMDIVVGDRTVRLEALLPGLFSQDSRWLGGGLDKIADEEAITIKTEHGSRLRFSAGRLKPVVRLLIDLFDGLGDGALRVSRLDAGRLEALNDTGRWQFHGDDSIRLLAQRLKGGTGIAEVAAPTGLAATLRSYQLQGLAWMQFLRENSLAGVLADDMGLGKTVQTLAHILAEKEAGRLDRPALIVMPTSLIHNWCEEARRFAPGLRVLSLHGSDRKGRFDAIGEHDLILTTYALLWRDQKVLSAQRYHLLILDEAQFVKNTRTKAATAIRNLDARHRLCLTGTPLENHLGELWSLFDFLLPGFLGTQQDFGKRWRTPIEKGGDTVRRDLLARRIRPFMLRRRKDEVATELPPKTLIVRRVDLDGGQRDLYEIVRTAMQEKVRAAIAAQGMERSHIVVLDALLKLRQVCCDPRLVKLEQAANVEESAKLELLLSILPDMIEEGRRVLLFSQFTGMLAIIAAAVEKAGINYVLLTGDTTDRATPVRRFQAGEVPLFLISLKAGGVGLNLTAADTVIHYDPWWNPAAENQATDRAHRLGQDKPVFVYKLIAAGSIEEKIVALQEKKAALAEGILSEDGAAAVKFSSADLDALFAPMPAME
jgi:hypothetical protein